MPPDGDGKCPTGTVKIKDACVSSKPDGGGDGDEDEEKSHFGGSCQSGFTCEGDALQCAMAREQHKRSCELFEQKSVESLLYDSEKNKEGNVTSNLENNSTVDLSSKINTSSRIGNSSCIADKSFDVMSTRFTIPFSSLCPYLSILGNILVIVSILIAYRIVTKG